MLWWRAQTYGEPTVIVAQRVTGEEEVPEGAVAVLTPDAPDVLSHVSVRARNMRVLFAICHDPEELAKVHESIAHLAIASCTEAAAATRPSGMFAISALVKLLLGPDRVYMVHQVSELSGKGVEISVTAAGGVEWSESELTGA